MTLRVPGLLELSAKRVAIVVSLAVFAAAATAEQPVERFLESLEDDPSVPAEARALVHESWSECQGCDAEEFLAQGLAVVSDRFRLGLDAYGAERYEQCAEIMGDLVRAENTSISVNAAVYQIKSLVALDRVRDADRLIETLTARGDNVVVEYSYFASEVDFLRGCCLLADLRYEAAQAALGRFLDDHAATAPRLAVAAREMLEELANRRPGGIAEIADLMGHCGRRLGHGDAGDEVQGRQQRIVELLDRLIAESEQRERSDAQGNGQRGRDSRGQSPGSPMQQSQLPGASPDDAPEGPDRTINPGEVWGEMPPRQRERILQALHDRLPSRYRRLVEQYYEELAKEP